MPADKLGALEANGLPPILTLAMADQEAMSLVTKTGIDINVRNLNLLPVGGRIKYAQENWAVVAPKDRFVTKVVSEGYKIDFISEPRLPMNYGNPPTDPEGQAVLDKEVSSMQVKGVIRQIDGNPDGAVSPFFARPKAKPGQWRPILSMKKVNKFVRYVKFRMTTVKDIKTWLQKDFYLTSLDLSDAYFSIPLHATVFKFVRFVWRDLTYEFMTNMFGLGPSARLFTKVLAPVVRFLRKALGAMVAGYIDDFIQQDEEKEECAKKTRAAIIIFFCLGFKVNGEKSEIEPRQNIQHLGFVWDTVAMTVTLPEKKIKDLEVRATRILEEGGCTLQGWQSFIGKLEATRPAVSVAPLHFRFLQALLPRRRTITSKHSFIPITVKARGDLIWWMVSMRHAASSPLLRRPYNLIIRTDASGLWGWGGHSARGATQRAWTGTESARHINWKEMEAGRGCLVEQLLEGDHILMEMDSTAAVSFINRMGGTRSAPLRDKALEIWELVLSRKAWVTARWIPREENQVADLLSKEHLLTWEFGLRMGAVDMVTSQWGQPALDLFASSNFHVVEKYCSLEADPQATRLDAFRLGRWPHWSYAFPPLPLLALTLDRIKQDRVRVIVILPLWKESLWWTRVEALLEGEPLYLGLDKDVLQPLPHRKLPRLGQMAAVLLNGGKSRFGTRQES